MFKSLQNFSCRPYKCDLCPLAFKVKLILKRHMLIHTTPVNISCSMCSKKFRRQDDLDAHLRSHLQYRKFACTFCSQTFVTSGGLKSHIGVHNGLRPFRCGMPKCPMTFIVRNTTPFSHLLFVTSLRNIPILLTEYEQRIRT